jgi:hypothetical protein
MRADRDRNHISLFVFLRGLLARERRCPGCRSRKVARSHTQFGAFGQGLRLIAMRCRACQKRFSLRDTVAGPSRRESPEAT